MSEQNPAPQSSALRGRRKRWLAMAIGGFAVIGIAWGVYWASVLRYEQSTDDAYVSGNVVQITPQISGTVVSIGADDTQFVKAGQTLVRLDKADSKVALDQAEAQLARTVREVRSLFATSAQLQSAIAVRQADSRRAESDLARRERLANSGAISGEELQHAREALSSARAALSASAATVRRQSRPRRSHDDRRSSGRQECRRACARRVSRLRAHGAAGAGRRLRRQARGAAGAARKPGHAADGDRAARPGLGRRQFQGAAARIDAHRPAGDAAPPTFMAARSPTTARSPASAPGTGSAFALLPAQNATGNWIKIVQRVPVRIGLDPQELAAHPLQIGLSMQVEVDTHRRAGDRLPEQPASLRRRYATDVFRSLETSADARVKEIIAANESGAARHRGARCAARDLRPIVGRSPHAGPQRTFGRERHGRCRHATMSDATRPPAPAPASAAPPLTGSALVLGTIALSLATFMNVLDTSIANVSIPAIAGDLGVSPDQGTWVITSFGVANAISLPLTGWLTQRFGQVRLFTASMLLFVLASFLCALAPSLGLLILFRVIQGAVAGPMIPLSQSLLLVELSRRKRAGTALAMWSITTLVAPVVGPLLGGWITDNISWPWIFYINIPVGLAAAAGDLDDLPAARNADGAACRSTASASACW